MIDLYPKDSWNFVPLSLKEWEFSALPGTTTTSTAGVTCIRPCRGDYSVFKGYYSTPITRSYPLHLCLSLLCVWFQMVTHEIEHIFGVKYCQWMQCVIQGSNHLEHSDRRPLDLCLVCHRIQNG
ncbi:unnamed protein product [Oncorhynchus mykiss]|uniref:Archaemetzincin-2 n=1 Tax=Oncorhynchus mykiss TaxID=8022 RepID=A0A060XWC6_ONCMY|nr:unnamed protein product [Oncorhynchus mykiss]